ncbi:MAG TPA: branched-chain amino acid ABC transporter substrate-binding protein [Clostridia bacterium]|nr:branched-chain amino acid ABC transporter substrate-binding protein [Clostridia bacterium]
MKRRGKLFTLLLVAVVLVSLLAGCGQQKEQEAKTGEIKIGVAAPLTGASAQDGESIRKGVELAVEQINAKGGINGKLVKLEVADDKTDPKEAAIVANKLAQDKSILAIVGHFNSSATLAGAPIYNKEKVVHISPGSSSPAVTDAGPYTFRVITTDAFQGEYVAEWAVKDEGFKRIAIIYENTDYGKGLSDVFSASVKKLGAEVVANESYILGETKDFSTVLTKIKNAKPDLLFIGGLYNEAALIAKQAKRLGLNLPMMGVDALYSDALISLGGQDVEGLLLPGFFHYSSTNPVAQEFIKAYREKYNSDPGTYAAYAYDAANIIFEAIQKAGEDRQKIADYITNLKDFQGATGINTFDENGDVLKEPLRLIIKNGKFEIYSE